ncbi:MAG: hydrogenase iron-sulfur subunit [Promethearchaeota archaeon]|nr:MAG: hydrogenase iron-sulfur subunit [Candidatus Lokiarchaeota archaeon]
MAYDHVQMLSKIFEHLNIEKERVQQYFCSAADVEKYITSVNDIVKKIHKLPPLPKKTD